MERRKGIPDATAVDVTGRLLLEKGANLLQLAPASAGIVEQIAELARVWLDLRGILLEARIALENENLVLGPAPVSERIHSGLEGAVDERARTEDGGRSVIKTKQASRGMRKEKSMNGAAWKAQGRIAADLA